MRAEHIEALARAMQRCDALSRDEEPIAWSALGETGREANLDAARFAPLLLSALGLEIEEGLRSDRRTALTDEELEAGARLEHLRWSRFTRRIGRIGHRDLRVWDDLDEATRELDRLRTRPLPQLLADLGYSVIDRVGHS